MENTIGNAYPVSSLSLLIPCYNDEATIERVIAEAAEVGKRVARVFEIVCLNDGSHDRTGKLLAGVAQKVTNLRVITHAVNQGYGRTIKELYFAGRHAWLFTVPGDYQVGAKELEILLPATGRAAMVIGWRVRRNDPTNRLIVSWVYNALLRVLFGLTLHDMNSVRLMRRSILQDIPLASSSAFVDAELVICAKHQGCTITEVPISHRPRADGERGGGNQWRTIWATIVDMVKYACHPRA